MASVRARVREAGLALVEAVDPPLPILPVLQARRVAYQELTTIEAQPGAFVEGAMFMWHAIRGALAKLRAAEWMPITAVRVLIGIFFCISGGTKLLVPAQFTMMEHTLAQSQIPFPHASALFVSLVEFASGAGLAVGLLTPLCALVLVVDMIVAVATNRINSIHGGGVLAWIDDFLYLPEVLYVMILVWLIFSGPGRYSIDGLILRRRTVQFGDR